jgi:hypothetical protein
MQRNPSNVTASAQRREARLVETGDRVGMTGSLLCAVHCALMPVLLAALPALGLGGFSLVDIDQGFTIFATLLGVTTLAVGFRRHRAFRAWLVLIPGLLLVWIGSFTALHDHSIAHTVVMVAGGLAIALAHLINLRLGHDAAGRALASGMAQSG